MAKKYEVVTFFKSILKKIMTLGNHKKQQKLKNLQNIKLKAFVETVATFFKNLTQ